MLSRPSIPEVGYMNSKVLEIVGYALDAPTDMRVMHKT